MTIKKTRNKHPVSNSAREPQVYLRENMLDQVGTINLIQMPAKMGFKPRVGETKGGERTTLPI